MSRKACGAVYAHLLRMSATVLSRPHSGWVVGVPELNKGLTGAKVARAMLQTQWTIFGVPSIITSDQGSHFVSAWWQTICAGLGVRCAQAQAYHYATNGRAEVAGQQFLKS